MTRIIAIASGAPAVGKTAVVVHLAAQLARLGKRVCVLDVATPGQGAVARLGLQSPTRLRDVADGRAAPGDLVCQHAMGFDVVYGGFDDHWAGRPGSEAVQRVAGAVAGLQGYDIMLLDTSDSFAQGLLAFALASPTLLVVITPATDALSDAYSLLKLLYSEQYAGTLDTLVNKAENQSVGKHSYSKFKEVASFYLDMQVGFAGVVEQSPALAAEASLEGDALLALAEHLMQVPQEGADIDVAAFAQTYAQLCSAIPAADTTPAGMTGWAALADDDGLYRQLDVLSGQVDYLIAEVARLRSDDASPASPSDPAAPGELVAFSGGGEQSRADEGCFEACIAAMATGVETLTVQGETFPIYQRRKADGEAQRFAFQTIDDGIEESESQTTSS